MELKRYPLEESLKQILWVSLLLQLQLMAFPMAEGASINALPDCKDMCGNVTIPYPFGIGPGCFKEGFELNCTLTNVGYKPFYTDIEVLNISLLLGQGRINNDITSLCYTNNTYREEIPTGLAVVGTPYRLSHVLNKFTTIGCSTAAYMTVDDKYQIGCISGCDGVESLIDGSCSGIGCCQTAIPKGINNFSAYISFAYNSSDASRSGPCSHAFLVEADYFKFDTNYVTTRELDGKQVPMVIEWAFGSKPCETAKLDRTTYACVSDNSECVNSETGPGYLCNCSKGYQGNPHLTGGCQDIDECAENDKYQCSGNCKNTLGGYLCTPKRSIVIALVIGISVSFFVLLLLVFCVYMVNERRKLIQIKEKYFRQHGGWLLYDEMRSSQRSTFKIFTKEELEEATNNFDDNTILGRGGYGTVYKGTLKDNRVVAIKRSKIINESQRKEFGKEMLILSQINHKNVVKLLGCCLEVEVPILVYEFVPNGTLFQLIHGENNISHVSLETRLRIAQESAEALSYLHSSASPPIIHGDVKPPNILLDEHYMAKVSDFGASMLAPIDETQFVTLVQGTCGYLDPEYLQTSILTDRSDVYSFGVVLLELFTGKKPFCFAAPEKERNLSSNFLSAMKANRLHEFLTNQITNEKEMELIKEVAELAMACLNIKGEERPTMKEVAEELDRLRKLKNHPWAPHNPEEVKSLLGESSNCHEPETNDFYSLEGR